MLLSLWGWTSDANCFSLAFFFFIAAFQKLNPTPELLEGQQCQQQCEDGCTNGAGESGGSVHRQSHRHGFQCTDVGGGEPSVRQKQAARWANDKDKKVYALFIPARLVVRLCPAGQYRFLIVFILCIFQLFLFFLYGVEWNCTIWDSMTLEIHLEQWQLIINVLRQPQRLRGQTSEQWLLNLPWSTTDRNSDVSSMSISLQDDSVTLGITWNTF